VAVEEEDNGGLSSGMRCGKGILYEAGEEQHDPHLEGYELSQLRMFVLNGGG
jgi:hypothetical protein